MSNKYEFYHHCSFNKYMYLTIVLEMLEAAHNSQDKTSSGKSNGSEHEENVLVYPA